MRTVPEPEVPALNTEVGRSERSDESRCTDGGTEILRSAQNDQGWLDGRCTVAAGLRAVLEACTFEGLALGAVLAITLGLRLVGIDNDTDVSDEGIRGLQLRLMEAGFRPVREIYASQGPLSLALFYPLYRLFGGDIVAARLAVVAYSLGGLLGVYWLARRLAGPPAGVAAAAILAVSPVYLQSSRLALVEIPSMAPAIFALLAVIRYRATGGRAWLIGSAVLLAVAALAKPMALTMGPAAVVLILAGRHRRLPDRVADLLLYGMVGAAVTGVVVALVGPAQVYEQLIDYRLGARAARGWALAANWSILGGELGREGIGLVLAAGVGVAILARRRPVDAGALLIWLGGGLALLLVYSPLFPKHVVYLLPPLALFAGIAAGWAGRALPGFGRRGRRDVLSGAAIMALVAYVGSGLTIVEQDRRLVGRGAGQDAARYADDLRLIAAVTASDEFIVMDDAYLALATGRLVPPHLADLSWSRIAAGALTAERAIAETERFAARAVVVDDAHLGRLPRYLNWADRRYTLVKAYVERRPNRFRRVYVRPGVDLAAARAALAEGTGSPLRAGLGPALLLGYSLDRRDLKAGDRFGLTLHWEALVATPAEHRLVVRLRGADGRPVHESRWDVGDGEQAFSEWAAGRWMFQAIRIPLDDSMPPAAYSLTLALERPDGRAAPVRSEAATWMAAGAELDLGRLTVR